MAKEEGITGLIKGDVMNSSIYISEMYHKNQNPFNCDILCCNNSFRIKADDIRLFFIKNKINKVDIMI